MHVDALSPTIVFASEVVRDATRVMRGAAHRAIADTFTKANGSPVTVADFVVQAFVASRLGRHVPEDPLAAEPIAVLLRKSFDETALSEGMPVAGPGELLVDVRGRALQ